MICVTLAGRAAEQLFFGNISTGALDDLQKVTNMIMSQVVELGMNERVGSISYNFQKEPSHIEKPFSESTAELIDEEIRNTAIKMYERTLALISEKKDLVEKVAQRLLQQEVLKVEDMIELVGPRPFPQASTYEEILQASKPDATPSPYSNPPSPSSNPPSSSSSGSENKTISPEIVDPSSAVIANPSTINAVAAGLDGVDAQNTNPPLRPELLEQAETATTEESTTTKPKPVIDPKESN